MSPDGSVDRPRRREQPKCFGGASAVRAWDTSTGEELSRIGHALDVNEVAFSPDGEHLVTAGWDGIGEDRRSLRPRDPSAGQSRNGFNFSDVAFSPDGRLVATAESSGSGGAREDLGLGAR